MGKSTTPVLVANFKSHTNAERCTAALRRRFPESTFQVAENTDVWGVYYEAEIIGKCTHPIYPTMVEMRTSFAAGFWWGCAEE